MSLPISNSNPNPPTIISHANLQNTALAFLGVSATTLIINRLINISFPPLFQAGSKVAHLAFRSIVYLGYPLVVLATSAIAARVSYTIARQSIESFLKPLWATAQTHSSLDKHSFTQITCLGSISALFLSTLRYLKRSAQLQIFSRVTFYGSLLGLIWGVYKAYKHSLNPNTSIVSNDSSNKINTVETKTD
jgi:hypothetical protein